MEESFIVSARKYRPDSWETVVGQQAITATLQNAIDSNQIAQAYLFCGPRGVGKTTCARIFAKEINKEALKEDEELSFNVFELDAASNNSVEDIRSITDQVRIPPQVGKYKVYIIDEVHMLSQAAFNAFLKTLEEPPPHAIFILATTEKHKIIPTILSRCQIFDFNRISVKDIASHLKNIAEKEGVKAEDEALHVIAQKADGALRDALSIFDQLVAFCGKEFNYDQVIQNLNVLDYDYYFKLSDQIIKEDISGALLTFNEITNHGFDGHQFIVGLGEHFRNLMVCKDEQTTHLMEVSNQVKEKYIVQAKEFGIRLLVQAIEFSNECDVQYRTSKNQRLLVELALMKMCSIKYNESEKKKSKFRIKPFKTSILPKLKEQTQVKAKAEAQTETFSMRHTPVVEIASKPLANFKKSETTTSYRSPSLKKMLEANESTADGNNSTEAKSNKKSRNFTEDELIEAWNAYRSILKKEPSKTGLYNALSANHPKLTEDYKIMLEVYSPIQIGQIDEHKAEVLEFIKNKLQNDLIELDPILVKSKDEDSKMLYTDHDKFNAMKEKNDALEYMRLKFNLDIEF